MYFNKSISNRICENLRNLRIRKRMPFVSHLLIEKNPTDNAHKRIEGAGIKALGNKRSLSHKKGGVNG